MMPRCPPGACLASATLARMTWHACAAGASAQCLTHGLLGCVQDTREGLVGVLAAAGPDAEDDEDALMAVLGQALGITLCLTSLNPSAMLGLLTARMDAPGAELSAPVPDSHWAGVLVLPASCCCCCCCCAGFVSPACLALHSARTACARGSAVTPGRQPQLRRCCAPNCTAAHLRPTLSTLAHDGPCAWHAGCAAGGGAAAEPSPDGRGLGAARSPLAAAGAAPALAAGLEGAPAGRAGRLSSAAAVLCHQGRLAGCGAPCLLWSRLPHTPHCTRWRNTSRCVQPAVWPSAAAPGRCAAGSAGIEGGTPQALTAAAGLHASLSRQVDLLLGRTWLLQPRLLTPLQVWSAAPLVLLHCEADTTPASVARRPHSPCCHSPRALPGCWPAFALTRFICRLSAQATWLCTCSWPDPAHAHPQRDVTCSVPQIALIIIHSHPVFPDMVAMGEACAAQQGGQPSVPALVSGTLQSNT